MSLDADAAHRAKPASSPAATSKASPSRVVTQNKDDGRLVPRQGALSRGTTSRRESYWARLAMPMAGRRSRLRADPGSRRRSAGRASSARTCAFRTCSARSGTARTSRRSPTTTARTTSASCSRARSTTCCSTTAPRAWSSSRTRRPQGHRSTTTASSSRTRRATSSRSTARAAP